MKFIITGSGGCVSIPRPLCTCKICNEARDKGYPYARCGCSLFLDDIKLLIDTPEDIGHALNHCNIKEINYLSYSHLDPDHTLGMRIIEQLRLNWLDLSVNKKCDNPINVLALPNVLNDVNALSTKYGSIFDYYESLNLIKRKSVNKRIVINDIKITFVPANEEATVTIFIFEQNGKKLIYAPCDVKPFPNSRLFYDADYLIIGNTIIGNTLKNNFYLTKNNPLNLELFSFEEVLELKAKYNIQNVIITHLEEDWGKSYDDYLNYEKECIAIKFAYDGMTIEL